MTTPNEELILKLRGQAYTTCRPDQLCDQAADLLQSLAERIKELDVIVASYGELDVEQAKHIACMESDLDTLRAQLADAELHNKQVERGLDKATAQLAEIEKTEPVAWRWVWKSKPWDIEGWCYTNTPPNHPELQEIEKLFTRPMPAQDVEASMIKLPEPDDTYCGVNYYTESQLKQAVRDALDALKDVAQTLAWTQHGECRGFSDGLLTTDEALDKARDALSKYKGAK